MRSPGRGRRKARGWQIRIERVPSCEHAPGVDKELPAGLCRPFSEDTSQGVLHPFYAASGKSAVQLAG